MEIQSYECICLYAISIYILKHRLSSTMHINVPTCVPATHILTYMHICIKGWNQWRFCPRLHKELGSNYIFLITIGPNFHKFIWFVTLSCCSWFFILKHDIFLSCIIFTSLCRDVSLLTELPLPSSFVFLVFSVF